jgi:ubiquitin-conjugating enzyme E2 M
LEGGVCVSVLRPWKPTYNMQHILFGLLFLFSDPNPNDPLNNDAAKDMRENRTNFARNVITAMRGGRVGSTQFPKNRGNV